MGGFDIHDTASYSGLRGVGSSIKATRNYFGLNDPIRSDILMNIVLFFTEMLDPDLEVIGCV